MHDKDKENHNICKVMKFKYNLTFGTVFKFLYLVKIIDYCMTIKTHD